MTRTRISAVVLGGLGAAAQLATVTYAHAQAARLGTPRAETKSEHLWYGPELALAYGAAYLLFGGGIALRQGQSEGMLVFSNVALGAGTVISLTLPPAIHWGHDALGEGLASFGGQLGAVALGGLSGLAVADLSDSGADQGTAFLVGAAVGHVLWATVDVLVLGRTERILERRITW